MLVDEATIRYLPWHEATAVVLVDLVDVDDGTPVAVSPRRILQTQVERAAAAGLVPKLGSELEFFLFKDAYDAAHAAGYHGLTPNSPYVEDYSVLQTGKEEDVLGAIRRGLRGAGFPLEHSKGEAGTGQHEVNLTYQTAVEMADLDLLFKHAVKEIAHRGGKSATFMAKPLADGAGSSGHIHASLWTRGRRHERDARRRRAPHERRVPLVPRRSAGDGPRAGGAVRPERQQLQAVPARQLGADRRSGGTSTTARSGSASSATARDCASRAASPAPTSTRTTRSRRSSPAASTASSSGSSRRRRTEATGTPPPTCRASRPRSRRPSSCGGGSELARERFGDDVHHHVLRHAEFEWAAFNRAVTDWERARYFERI